MRIAVDESAGGKQLSPGRNRESTEAREAQAAGARKLAELQNEIYRLKDDRLPEHWLWEYRGIHPESSAFAIAKDNEGGPSAIAS